MLEAQFFGLTYQATYRKPVPYPRSGLLDVSEELLDAFRTLGARPAQVESIKRDELYNYELKATFFNGNGTYSVNAERLEIAFFNGRSREDVSTIVTSLLFLHQHSKPPEDAANVLIGYAHGKLGSETDRDSYFGRFGSTKEVVVGQVTAYIHVPAWSDEIRLVVDRSNVVPAGLFLSWSTGLTGRKLAQETVADFGKAIQTATQMAGIEFAELK